MNQKIAAGLKGKDKGPLLFIVVLVVLLPVLIGGVFVVQKLNPQASASCPPINIKIKRSTTSTAQITFETSCAVKAQVYCAAGRAGTQFFCGEDSEATQTHVISTDEVTLSTNVGYYVFIDTELETRTLGFIPASPVDTTYGLNFDSLDEKTMGTTSEDADYDPALDINQDGVINVLDKVEFYPDAN